MSCDNTFVYFAQHTAHYCTDMKEMYLFIYTKTELSLSSPFHRAAIHNRNVLNLILFCPHPRICQFVLS